MTKIDNFKPNRYNTPCVVLASCFEKARIPVIENPYEQIQSVMGWEMGHKLIEIYNFEGRGQVNYSQKLDDALTQLLSSGYWYQLQKNDAIQRRILEKNLRDFGRSETEKDVRLDISDEDYEFLRDIGRKIHVKDFATEYGL